MKQISSLPDDALLVQGLLQLETPDETRRVVQDLFTPAEIRTLTQRIQVARMLSIRATYSEIERQTGASTATISRVNRSVRHGAGGYKAVLSRINR